MIGRHSGTAGPDVDHEEGAVFLEAGLVGPMRQFNDRARPLFG